MSKITVHAGDLFANAPAGSILVHACNTQGSWGGGIATAFKEHFPNSFQVYKTHCESIADRDLLGTCLLIPPQPQDAAPGADSEDSGHWIACLFTSRKYGKAKDSKDVILQSTKTAVTALQRQIQETGSENRPVYGCRINAGAFRVPWSETVAVLDELGFEMIVYEIAP